MSIRSNLPRAPWVTITIIVWTVGILGLGLWVSIATGQWFALLLAAGLVVPWETVWMRWSENRAERKQQQQQQQTRQ